MGALVGSCKIRALLLHAAVMIKVGNRNDGLVDSDMFSLQLEEVTQRPGGMPKLEDLLAPQAFPAAVIKKLNLFITPNHPMVGLIFVCQYIKVVRQVADFVAFSSTGDARHGGVLS